MTIVGGLCASNAALFDTDTDKARALCLQCPVQQACLQFALERNEPYGIWGGYDFEQRQRLRRGETVRLHPVDADGHGYLKYRRGECRCRTCCEANTEHHRRYRAANRRPTLPCVQCGVELRGRGRYRYCSARCRRLFASRESRVTT